MSMPGLLLAVRHAGESLERRLLVENGTTMLFFQLATALPLLPLDPFPLGLREHLFVLNSQFPTMNLQTIHRLYHEPSILRGLEVGESETAENATVKMVVKRIGLRQMKVGHQLGQSLLPDGEWDILYHDCRGDQLVGFAGLGIRAASIGGNLIHAKARR